MGGKGRSQSVTIFRRDGSSLKRPCRSSWKTLRSGKHFQQRSRLSGSPRMALSCGGFLCLGEGGLQARTGVGTQKPQLSTLIGCKSERSFKLSDLTWDQLTEASKTTATSMRFSYVLRLPGGVLPNRTSCLTFQIQFSNLRSVSREPRHNSISLSQCSRLSVNGAQAVP